MVLVLIASALFTACKGDENEVTENEPTTDEEKSEKFSASQAEFEKLLSGLDKTIAASNLLVAASKQLVDETLDEGSSDKAGIPTGKALEEEATKVEMPSRPESYEELVNRVLLLEMKLAYQQDLLDKTLESYLKTLEILEQGFRQMANPQRANR